MKPAFARILAATAIAAIGALGITSSGPANAQGAAPRLMKSVPCDPLKEFTPIARGGNLIKGAGIQPE